MRVRNLFQSLAPRGETRWLVGASLVLLVPLWVIPFALLRNVVPAGELLPLHYNVHLGVDYVGPWWGSLYFPGFATFVLILNTLLAAQLRKESKLLANILSVATLFVAVFTLLASFFVLVLNA